MDQRLTPSTAIGRVAAFTHSLELEAVPGEVRRQAALSLLDTIGCMVAGSATSDARALLAAEGADAGFTGGAGFTVVGCRQRLSPRAAARCNGYLGDIFELNDLTGGHASIATVAAALTAAEMANASGRALLEAVQRRRGQVVGPDRLPVIVRVDVHEAGRHDAPGRVDLTEPGRGAASRRAYAGDAA